MIRVAVVGTGGIASGCHMPALAAQAHRAEVVAAVDVDADRVKAFAAEHSIPAAYTSLTEMLEAERPDLVHLCTPPFLHAEQARECLEAGAWVWCEKPLALSLAQVDTIAAAESEAGPYCSVVFQHRFGSGARHLRALTADGTLGRPLVAQCVTAWFRNDAYFEVPWRAKWATEGGGPTMGHGIHQFDLLLSVFGEWSEIRAMAGRLARHTETEDVSMAIVRFANGAMASITNSVLSPREESYLRFDYEQATVELRHLYGYDNGNWSSESELWSPPENIASGHHAQLDELLNSLERGERPAVSGPEARATMELAAGLYASALTGQPVKRSDLTPGHPFYHGMNGGLSL
ncbi:Gfo/Idh/MocA family protein [Nonomuraea soli]|uniref:Putative dehydrogenase n=1 Tax=Nonomuraea soli TaxID=1032476 RepID=A0A7W0HSQ8_9ACTN|nr:Gfo/Idh/MocA family oxidoreductase [Nonomuraea soli]MBA2894338.1 putative dehydrogenase [Nonomuraea soli]